MWECGIGFDEIMCDGIIFEDLHFPSIARMDYITCDDWTYDDINLDVCENVVLGLMI